jgi:hypothetical protein
MKVSGFIMAFYLLLLAAIPCRDNEECKTLTKTEATSGHNEHEEEEDCTPFCVCACCPSPVHVSDLAVENFSVAAFSSKPFLINSSVKSFISHSIWQPPRGV